MVAVGLAMVGRTTFVRRATPARPTGARPAVLLLTLDSTRADHLGCYGRPDASTPHLDALARDGVLFENAYAQAPLCLPSHASMLTGRLPRNHGLREDLGQVLGTLPLTLAETFQRHGYRTAAFVSATVFDRSVGLARGFDLYQDDLGPPGKVPGRAERSLAFQTVDRATAWAAQAGDRPFLLWVHLDDARAPRHVPEPFDRQHGHMSYAGALAYMDGQVGRLLSALKSRRPELAVAVLADHGESLGEHGEETHGRFIYSATTRVPFLLSMPEKLPPGARVGAVVRVMDLMPTLIEMAGLTTVAGLDGASLVPLATGRHREGPGPATIENLAPSLRFGMRPQYGLRAGPYLYVAGHPPELFDSEQDPPETDEASARLPRIAATMREQLEALLPDSARPRSEPDRPDLYERYRNAGRLEAAGMLGQAADAYRRILIESPRFAFARRRLAECLFRKGRFRESADVFNEIVRRGEALEITYRDLALVEYRLGHPQRAVESLQQGVEAFPHSAAVRYRAGKVLLELGRPTEAARELEQAVSIEPLFLDAQLSYGRALEALGRSELAATPYRFVRQRAPDSEEARQAAKQLALLERGR